MNEKRTIASQLEERVRRDIISGRLKPGSKMRLRELSVHYDAGVIPLREALSRLAMTGFVSAVDQKGFSVQRISAPELRDVTRTRLHIECRALALSIENADIEWESQLVAAHHRMGRHEMRTPQTHQLNADWEEAHEAFHAALLANCGSPWLLRFVDTLCDQTLRYRALAAASPVGEGRDIALEHRQLMEAALARDVTRATMLLTEHYMRTMAIVLESDALAIQDTQKADA
ncbi:GntR family transcriptional regulator [Pluralibacter gergoviae]|uniref:GntR family transcriptional regulator n=1 Tax=Pluralibacter gergoviae TaxID=61647 RepID=UPI0004F5B0E5|nr:FCD domain-containing protein [Pluralibacter gergoviae]AIR00212.1 GntR family transcriptional regulator [Pluralibacter gergoviae]